MRKGIFSATESVMREELVFKHICIGFFSPNERLKLDNASYTHRRTLHFWGSRRRANLPSKMQKFAITS